MNCKILTYEAIDRGEWSRLVQTSATGTWFQSPEAYGFYESLPELFRPFAIAVERVNELTNERALRGVCVGYVTVEKSAIKQFFTRRAIINGGVCLADNATNADIETLLAYLRNNLSNKAIYVEIRNFNDYGKWREAFERAGFGYKKHLNFHVDCMDEEAMWERLSENRRRQLKKTAAISELAISELEIREWYGILERLYRTKVKTPLWPVEFFLEAYRQGVGKFLLVKHEGKIIGGSMVVVKEPTSNLQGRAGDRLSTVYEWFECGMNAEYKEQYPSVMATWAGMKYAAEHGCARYDMMGAGEPDVPYGVRDFKSEFGGEMVEHGRYLCVTKPLLYQVGKLGVWLLKRIK